MGSCSHHIICGKNIAEDFTNRVQDALVSVDDDGYIVLTPLSVPRWAA